MSPRSMSLASVDSIDFGPHRGAFRFLYLQVPEKTRRLCQVGCVDPDRILAGESVVSSEWLIRFWELFDSLPNEYSAPNAIAAGRLFMLQDLGDFGKAFQHAPSFELGFRAWQDHAGIRDFLTCRMGAIGHSNEGRRIALQWKLTALTGSAFVYGCSLLLFSLLGLGMHPNHILQVDVPAHLISQDLVQAKSVIEALRTEFGVALQTSDQEDLTLQVSDHAWGRPTRLSDHGLFRFYESRILHSNLSGQQSHSQWISLVRLNISALLHDSKLQSKTIAQELGLSQRTFERRLQESETSFRDLKQEVQKQRAIELLATGHSPKGVAQSVGFDDFSAFSRAFKKWTGKTPSELHISSIHKKGTK